MIPYPWSHLRLYWRRGSPSTLPGMISPVCATVSSFASPGNSPYCQLPCCVVPWMVSERIPAEEGAGSLLPTYHLSATTHYPSSRTYHLSSITYHLSPITYLLSCIDIKRFVWNASVHLERKCYRSHFGLSHFGSSASSSLLDVHKRWNYSWNR